MQVYLWYFLNALKVFFKGILENNLNIILGIDILIQLLLLLAIFIYFILFISHINTFHLSVISKYNFNINFRSQIA